MVVADAPAMAKWEHYKGGTDLEALAWRDAQARTIQARIHMRSQQSSNLGIKRLSTSQGVFVGSYGRGLPPSSSDQRRAGALEPSGDARQDPGRCGRPPRP